MSTATLKRAHTYDETKFDMPRIAQAKPVLWFPDRHLPECYTAIVTGVHDRSIDVAIFFPDHTNHHVKNGVRHRNDPDGEIIDRTHDGVWDYPEDNESGQMVMVIKQLKSIIDRVEKLEKK